MLKGNMLIAHGGGPTPVINSSLLGAVREAKRHPEAIETIYGARYGAEGILAGDLIDLGAPYIHYVSTQSDSRDRIFYDGSTQRRYFEMPDGTRINKGFMAAESDNEEI